ncbi:hypothetical protein PENNAL_c0011G02137 [Penicillium nalgiovense]|uniref:Uncharacterized protein n=1 Tax=Penicillium nalgiovense TaxID=60175 RepID=A0A1V6YTU4_PENNA|nr:hypothetical protein PENNAL_c0011G02137 [Penicillium nalgiovense]
MACISLVPEGIEGNRYAPSISGVFTWVFPYTQSSSGVIPPGTDICAYWIKNKREKLPSHSFLQMNQYGPWELTNADDMKEFAGIALAIMLEADS